MPASGHRVSHDTIVGGSSVAKQEEGIVGPQVETITPVVDARDVGLRLLRVNGKDDPR